MTKYSNTPSLTIGRLAQAADINVETIRYYQRIGMIDEPTKPRQGFRVYSPATLERIRFIKRAQQLGFSLNEISELMALGDGHCSDVRQRAEQKRDKIRKQITDLQALAATLDTLIDACHAGADEASCPIVESLLDAENKTQK